MSYFAGGFNPFQGQASQQYPFHQDAPAPPPGAPIFPGLQPPFPPVGFEPPQNTIPGLAFGGSQHNGSWQQPVPPPAPIQPKLVAAANYYQYDTGRPSQPRQALNLSMNGTAEEGEVSEGAYDDLYEPAEATVIHNTDGADDYDPADPGWYTAPVEQQSRAAQRDSHMKDAGSADLPQKAAVQPSNLNTQARDRSRSYSPYLMPHEIRPTTDSPDSARRSAAQNNASVDNNPTSEAQAVLEKKQKAAAAIQELWSLDVRFRNYVDEGVDPSIVRALFGDLGLDASNTAASATSATQIPGISPVETAAPAATITTTAKASANSKPPQIPGPSLSPESLANKKAEERKDRIARLYAAKATTNKNDTATTPVNPGPTEKEVKLKQKMEALQKAREARAQKAASKKDVNTGAKPEAAAPKAASTNGAGLAVAAPGHQTEIIPGLPAPPAQPAAAPPSARKRPVASDFVDAPTGPSKRPFGQQRRGKLVIDVSEDSEDDDVEMDMGSGDESLAATAGPLIHRTSSFRDVPPLAETNLQRRVASPGSKKVVTPPNGNAADMDQEIERMRRKIALAEARQKLKMAMNKKDAATPKSNAPTPDASAESIAPKPALRRVQSMDPPTASASPSLSMTGPSSPAAQEETSLRLPKSSDAVRSARSYHQERIRTLSQSLPQLDGRLQAKTKKLHLLRSQISRLEREIEQEAAEKMQMEDEITLLEAASTPEEPETHESSTSEQAATIADTASAAQQTEVLQSPPAQAIVAAPETVTERDTTSQPPSGLAVDIGPVEAESARSTASRASREVEAETEAEVSSSMPEDAADEPLDSVATRSEDQASSGSGEVHESGSDEGPAVDTEMEIDDALDEQQAENADAVTSPPRESGSLPGQISLGADDSMPDEGVGSGREAHPAFASAKPTGVTVRERKPLAVESTTRSSDKVGFKPYISPLESFRDYRYHPSYAGQVSGGLRSLTYSNQIDPNLPVCPDQLDGRKCPKGDDCEYQHFESMTLPDDQILLQLGATKLEGAERARFNSGLRELLQSMREQSVKDFPRIAQGIVDYHNRFNDDPSKILSLGDVTL